MIRREVAYAGRSGRLEQSVDAQYELLAGRAQGPHGGERLGRVDRLGGALGGAGAAGQLGIDPEAQARRSRRTVGLVARAGSGGRCRGR